MSIAAGLLGYAAVLAFLLPAPLRRAGWVLRAPRPAIALWRVASAATLASVLLAGLALATGWLLDRQDAPFGHPVGPVARTAYTGGSAPDLAAVGLALTAVVVLPVAWCLADQRLRARRERRRHLAGLTLLGRTDPQLGAVVIPAGIPAVYCLPGRRGRVVATSTAVRVLDPDQLRAVLDHERAHLRGRHHQLLGTARGLARAFPGIPLFRHAPDALAILIEMAADDTAARRHRADHLAAAHIRLGLTSGPDPALAAGGKTAIRRVERMLSPPRPLRLPARTTARILTAGLLAGPAAAACLPLAILACLAAAT